MPTPSPRNVLGVRLRQIRARDDLSQQRAAKRIRVHYHSWLAWEKGHARPDSRILHLICRTFDVSADWLLGLPHRRNGRA